VMGFSRRAALVALTATASLSMAGALPAGAVSSAGQAVIVTGAGSSTPRAEGGSATPFSLRLPSPAACPGDSTDGNYRVQSFIVPASADPGTMRWNDIAPVVNGGYSLYDVNTTPYSEALTAKATRQGGPGPIVNIPSFSFAVFLPPGRLAPGQYHVGIACSLFNVIDRYWVTTVVITRDPSDHPAEIHWRALDEPPAAVGSGSSAWVIVVPVALVLLGAGFSARRLRSRRRQATR